MASVLSQYEETVLAHGVAVETYDAILDDLFGAPRALNESEKEALRGLGFDDADLTVQVAREAMQRRLANTRLRERRVMAAVLTTGEVADLLGKGTSAQVRVMVGRGQLYALPRVGRETLFPDWQFVGGAVLPGLRDVLSAMPKTMQSFELEDFMLASNEALGDTPAGWLARGGDPALVANLLREEQLV